MSGRISYTWCRVCLIENVRMCSIDNVDLVQIYRKLTNTQAPHKIPKVICYICYSQVQRAYRFSVMASRSQKTLKELHQRGVEPHKMETLPNIKKAFNLCMTDVLTTSVSDPESEAIGSTDTCTVETKITNEIAVKPELNFSATLSEVKQEICEVEIKMEATSDNEESITEEYNKIEISIDPNTLLDSNEIIEKSNDPIACKTCNTCNKVFNKKCTLLSHIRTHTGEKPYQCNFCSKSFSEKGTLRKHIRIHTGEKPHECNLCHRKFTRKYNLRCHLRIHSKEKLYKCNWCQKTFTHTQTLQSHVRIHTGEKPYKCSLCDGMFTQRISLQSHMRTHTGEKPYVCNTCNKAFAVKGNLQNHLRIHTGEKPHVCNICNRAFTEKSNLKSHLKIHT